MALTKQEKIVLDFIGAFRESWPADLVATLKPMAEDGYYQIVVPTTPPIRGRDNVLAELRRMQEKVSDQKHHMKGHGSNGNTVFVERVDYSLRNGKWTSIPLVAVFELNDDGEIIAWREYLDLVSVTRSHGITVDALLKSLELT